MWARHSHSLQPLTTLTLTKVTFKRTDVEQHAFDKVTKTVACDTLLIYLYFNEIFYIHTYVSDFKLGAVISYNRKIISFYSRKLITEQ